MSANQEMAFENVDAIVEPMLDALLEEKGGDARAGSIGNDDATHNDNQAPLHSWPAASLPAAEASAGDRPPSAVCTPTTGGSLPTLSATSSTKTQSMSSTISSPRGPSSCQILPLSSRTATDQAPSTPLEATASTSPESIFTLQYLAIF